MDTGGKIRDYHIVEYLSRKHEVWFAGFREKNLKENETSLPFIPRERCLTTEPEDLDIRAFLRKHDVPYWCLGYYSEKMEKILDTVIEKNRFDYIHISHSYMAQYVTKYKGVIGLVDHQNVKTILYHSACAGTNNPLRKINYSAEYYKWYKYEREVLRNFEFHLACSPVEQKAIENFVHRPVRLLPSGVDTERFYEKKGMDTGANLLFTGSFDYFPNHEAAVFFCKKILPLIRKAVPNVVFQVVGRQPREALEKLIRKTPNTWFSCNVRDIRPFYYQSAVAVVPLSVGAGTRLKIPEAMATGLPVVSTSKGCEGLGLANGEGIIIADDPAQFAEAVISLLKDSKAREGLSRKAAVISRERFSWNEVLKPLDAIYL